MNPFTTDLFQALVIKQDVTEVFRSHLEKAMSQLVSNRIKPRS